MRKSQRPLPIVFAKSVLMCIVSISFSFALCSPSIAATDTKSLQKLEQFVRTGDDGKALQYIEFLSKERSTAAKTYDLSQTADFLIGRKKWELATRYLEVFPQSEPGWGYILIKQKLEDAKGDQKKLDDIENWLKKRLPSNRVYWTGELHRFSSSCGRVGKFFSELESQIKKRPSDLELLKRYLSELSTEDDAHRRNISWIPSTVHPPLAIDNYRIAEVMKTKYPTEAMVFLNRAHSIKFTEADRKAIIDYLRKNTAMAMFQESVDQKMFSVWIRSMQVECYKKLGQNAKAQALLVALSKEQGGKTPYYALTQTAGEIQSQTVAHPLEQQIKKAEPANENTLEYWSGRADYYRGRKDNEKEKSALQKALNLAVVNAKSSDSDCMIRTRVVRDYAMFLKRTADDKVALAYLWSEFEKTPNQKFRVGIIRIISDPFETDNTHYLKPTDSRLLKFLAGQQAWSYDEERLVWRMARNAASPSQLNEFWKEMERLAAGNGSRESTLGWVMNRCSEAKRSLPLLKDACTRLKGDDKQRASFTLFESYLDLSDWRNAENIWSEASVRLTENERPDWLGRIALAAAKSGDKPNAMRLWKKKDHIDAAALGHLEGLVKSGMRSEMFDYYTKMQKQKPDNSIPKEALKIIASVKS